MEPEVKTLTRSILFEKSPLKIKINFNKICDDIISVTETLNDGWIEWYLLHDGYIFVADKNYQDDKMFNVNENICDNYGEVYSGFYIHKKYCKILSGY